MRPQELRSMNDDQLIEQIKTFQEELFNLRFQQATGELENTSHTGQVKRDVARGLTIARERGIDLVKELST